MTPDARPVYAAYVATRPRTGLEHHPTPLTPHLFAFIRAHLLPSSFMTHNCTVLADPTSEPKFSLLPCHGNYLFFLTKNKVRARICWDLSSHVLSFRGTERCCQRSTVPAVRLLGNSSKRTTQDVL